MPDNEQKILFKNQKTGALGFVPSSAVGEFDKDGDYRRASNEDYEAERARQQAESIPGRAETFGRGVAQGVGSSLQSLDYVRNLPAVRVAEHVINPAAAVLNDWTHRGLAEAGVNPTDISRSLPSQAVGLAGGDEQGYAARDRELQGYNPGTMTAGQLTGEVIASLPTGVGGAVGKTALSRAGIAALRGAAEGGVFGAGSAIRDAQARGTGATDEELLSGGLFGATLGGAMGGGMSLAGSGLSKLKTKAGASFEDLMGYQTRQAESGLVGDIAADGTETLAGRVKRMMATDTSGAPMSRGSALLEDAQVGLGANRDAVREFGALNRSPEARASRALVRDAEKIHEQAIGTVSKSIGNIEDAVENVVRPLWGNAELKAAQITPKLVDPVIAKRAAIETASALNDDLSAKIAELRTNYGGISGTAKSEIRSTIGLLERNQQSIQHALENNLDMDAGHWVAKLENFKRAVGRDKMSINLGAKGEASKQAAQDVRKILDETYEQKLRPFLEDESILGDVAKMQKAVNVPYKQMLDDDGAFRDQFLRANWRKDWESGSLGTWVDPAKVDASLRRVGRYEDDPLLTMVSGRTEGAQKLLQAVRDNLDLSPEQLAKVDTAIAATSTLKTELADTLSRVGKVNRFRDGLGTAEARTGQALGAMPGLSTGVGATVAGGLVGGPIGALVGAGTALTGSMLFRPATMALASDTIADVAAKVVGARWLNHAGGLVHGAAKVAGKVARPVVAVARAEAAVAKRAAIPVALELFRDKDKDLSKAYSRRVDELLALSEHPTAAIDRIRKVAPALDDAPELAGAVVNAHQRAVGFLVSKMPSAVWVKNPLSPNSRPVPSQEAIANYAKAWEAVANPSTVVRDLMRGQAVPVQMEALRECYPRMLAALQGKVWDEIQKADEKKTPIPLYRRQQLDILLGLNGAGVPALSQEFADKVLAMRQAKTEREAQQQPPSSKPVNLSGAMGSSDRQWPSARGA